jgi:predicted amidohydrolase YtcJ
MNVGRGELQALHALNDSGRLRLRVRTYLAHDRLDEWIERAITTGDGDDMLRAGGVKYFADGALGSLTAWMFEPYATTGETGFPLQPVEDLERDVRRALDAGLAPAVHAIGDRATHEVLDMFDRLRDIAPQLPRRLEHAQLLRHHDLQRFGAMGVAASMQPIHATADWRKVDREWGERGRLAYTFASLQRTGATIAFGSDSPVETLDPLAGIHAAVTRRTSEGQPPGGWYPEERMHLDAVLRGYTSGPAAAAGEPRLGRIAPGYAGDFTALSHDPFDVVDEMNLLDVRVDMTVIGGEVVYRRRP